MPNKIPPVSAMVCFSVYSAGLAFNQLYRGLLAKFGLTYTQFLILVVLQERGPLKVGEFREALFLDSNTLTPLLKRMEVMGLLNRKRDQDDERVVHIALSKTGTKLIKDIGCVPPQVLQATKMPLSEITALTAKLKNLTLGLREYSQPNQRS
jgi:MarR family transcriptional regulator, organic hydroperoxide resistance regulator